MKDFDEVVSEVSSSQIESHDGVREGVTCEREGGLAFMCVSE